MLEAGDISYQHQCHAPFHSAKILTGFLTRIKSFSAAELRSPKKEADEHFLPWFLQETVTHFDVHCMTEPALFEFQGNIFFSFSDFEGVEGRGTVIHVTCPFKSSKYEYWVLKDNCCRVAKETTYHALSTVQTEVNWFSWRSGFFFLKEQEDLRSPQLVVNQESCNAVSPRLIYELHRGWTRKGVTRLWAGEQLSSTWVGQRAHL